VDDPNALEEIDQIGENLPRSWAGVITGKILREIDCVALVIIFQDLGRSGVIMGKIFKNSPFRVYVCNVFAQMVEERQSLCKVNAFRLAYFPRTWTPLARLYIDIFDYLITL
jgi:hypothetical protein